MFILQLLDDMYYKVRRGFISKPCENILGYIPTAYSYEQVEIAWYYVKANKQILLAVK